MISEDHQQLGHPLPAYALLALNTMRLMHTAEIAAILKGGQGWVKVDVEAGSVEALRLCAPSCMGRKQVRQKGIDELRCGELVLELAKKQGTGSPPRRAGKYGLSRSRCGHHNPG